MFGDTTILSSLPPLEVIAGISGLLASGVWMLLKNEWVRKLFSAYSKSSGSDSDEVKTIFLLYKSEIKRLESLVNERELTLKVMNEEVEKKSEYIRELMTKYSKLNDRARLMTKILQAQEERIKELEKLKTKLLIELKKEKPD